MLRSRRQPRSRSKACAATASPASHRGSASSSQHRKISSTATRKHQLRSPLSLKSARAFSTASPPQPDPSNLVILGIETSCDDTGISIVNSQKQVVANEMLSQLGLHQLHGGVVPTVAMRSHAITINYLLSKSLLGAGMVSVPQDHRSLLPLHSTPTNPAPSLPDFLPQPPPVARKPDHAYLANTQHNHSWLEKELDKMDQFRCHTFLRGRTDSPTPLTAPSSSLNLDIDAIAFTLGPGLSGSLAVGVDTAKALGKCFSLPIIPVNHIIAHTTVAQLQDNGPNYPYLGVVISGGHTQLNYVKDETCVTVISSTVDDAVGEAYDKVYRTMNMESFDFQRVQHALVEEQQMVKNVLQLMKFKGMWPESMAKLVQESNNELLIDAYGQLEGQDGQEDPTSQDALQTKLATHFFSHLPPNPQHPSPFSNNHEDTSKTKFDPNGDVIEQLSLSFLHRIQTIPDLNVHKVQLDHVGCVNDLFNSHTTPTALLQTFTEAEKLLNHHTLQHHQDPITSPPSHSPDPPDSAHTLASNQTLNPSSLPNSTDPTPSITPASERVILEKLSNSKTIPHGAQVELTASLYVDLAHILGAYDFLIETVLQQSTPLLDLHHDAHKIFFAQETNRCFGLARKAAQFTIQHRFLPLIPLPLPLHAPSAVQSFTGFSMAGLKTKIRQYCGIEMGLMQSVVNLREQNESSVLDDRNTSAHNLGVSTSRSNSDNPYNRTRVDHPGQVPPYLSHLLSPQPSTMSPPITSVSNVYRLTAASQFQTTTTQHFAQSISRSLQYLHHSIPGQDGVYLSTQPQSLHMLSMLGNDPSLHIGHSSNTPSTLHPSSIWTKFTKSIFPLDRPVDIVIGGGVACNKAITNNLKLHFDHFTLSKPSRPTPSNPTPPPSPPSPHFKVHTVTPKNCGDNGVMIAWAGLQKFHTALLSQNAPFNASDPTSSNQFSDDPILSHIIDATMLDQQQQIMDQEFMKLVAQTTNPADRQKLSTPTGAESFSVLYQRPKWPLPEVFVNKPVKVK